MAKIRKKVLQEFEVKYLHVTAEVRYWDDAQVNGEEDSYGSLIPCREGADWCPEIDVDTGRITNWDLGVTSKIHYKVCDAGSYWLYGANGEMVVYKDGYVPSCLSPGGNGYGDYIIMNIDENGMIENWKFDSRYFEEKDE